MATKKPKTKVYYKIITTFDESRLANLANLEEILKDEDYELVVDSQRKGAKWSHSQALMSGSSSDHTHICVIEDDALPVANFKEKLSKVIEEYPDRLVSLYLGTGYPTNWSAEVYQAEKKAEGDYIELSALIHGVCYVFPTGTIDSIFPLDGPAKADFAVGNRWLTWQKTPVLYKLKSLVDHMDDKSLENPEFPYNVPRKARHLDD